MGLLDWQLVLPVPQDGRPLSPAEPGVVFLDLPDDVLLVHLPAVGFLLPAPAVARAILVEELSGAASLAALGDVIEEKLVLVDRDVRVAAFREVDSDGRCGRAGRVGARIDLRWHPILWLSYVTRPGELAFRTTTRAIIIQVFNDQAYIART